ncbi:hypothetical protein [Brevundimonas vesicularis]|uniref:Uncharacterized protein n=1 Tax=Brevundimonas vesicularis TaxID=41276 RepID=A0A1Z3U563_BREVE|nr:hypothetical protein [Brevundimonas vesicularis]ASE38392.1 hypothetical protein CEP68_02110 [Brevundimonas vesicularis]
MTTPQIDTAPPSSPFAADDAATTAGRVADLLIRLERAAPRLPTLTPIADLHPLHDGTGEVFVMATVFLSLDDGQGSGKSRAPFALHELRLAADCLDHDPPFPAAPSLAPALRTAAASAATAALLLQRSLT